MVGWRIGRCSPSWNRGYVHDLSSSVSPVPYLLAIESTSIVIDNKTDMLSSLCNFAVLAVLTKEAG